MIPLRQITGSIFIAVLAFVSLVVLGVRMLTADGGPGLPHAFQLALWVVLVLLGMWHALTWPARAYRHTSYRVDDQGMEIRRGVFWRVVINVPKSRVQHIDVAQGPIARRYGLGTLTIYTAGTDHAKVELAGLEHGRALRIREHLLDPTTQTPRGGGPGVPSGAGDAV